MSMSLETTNYKIPYWDGTDVPQLAVDVPEMANKIDTIIHDNLPDMADIENQLTTLNSIKADKTALNTTNANLTSFENYLNFGSKTGSIKAASSSTNKYDSLTLNMSYALNSDNTYGKIYGYFAMQLSANFTGTEIIVPTSLSVTNSTGSEYSIMTGGMGIKFSSSGTIQTSVTTPSIIVSSTGLISIRFNNLSGIAGGYLRGTLPACLYNFRSFGDN